VVKALKTPDIQEKLVAMGAEPIGTPPQEFAAFMTAQNEKLRKTMQAAGLRPK
jgi:tripartite-type tricarboxylate transporter receptor subunit TctC